jgi:hypothetical protein
MEFFESVYNCWNTLAIACFLIVIIMTFMDKKYPMKLAGYFCWFVWVPNLVMAALWYSGVLK